MKENGGLHFTRNEQLYYSMRVKIKKKIVLQKKF